MNDRITKERLKEALEFYLTEYEKIEMPQLMATLESQLRATIESLCEHYKEQFPDVAEKYRKRLEEEKAPNSLYQN